MPRMPKVPDADIIFESSNLAHKTTTMQTSNPELTMNMDTIFIITGGVAAVALTTVCLIARDNYKRNNGQLHLCRFPQRIPAQVSRDREMAEALQNQLNEEIGEQEIQQNRQARREWYDFYLLPFTTVSPDLSIPFCVGHYTFFLKVFLTHRCWFLADVGGERFLGCSERRKDWR
jgi:hypothetical protein